MYLWTSEVKERIKMSGGQSLTICFPHYNGENVLERILCYYDKFADSVLENLKFIIVDDGSRTDDVERVVESHRERLQIRLFRMTHDIPWNMSACNNVAFRFADTEYVLRTDIDHVFPEETIKWLQNTDRLRSNQYYTFYRYATNDALDAKQVIRPHINTHMLHRRTYIEARGYDEVFRGHYGKEDSDFRQRLSQRGISETRLNLKVLVLSHCSSREYSRDTTVNTARMTNRTIVPLRHIGNFETPFYEVVDNGSRCYYPQSNFPPVYGLMIVKNDCPVMGGWLAHHAHLYEGIHVLDGSDSKDAEFIASECKKYNNVYYEHESECDIQQPTDHDLRRPGLSFIRRRFGRGHWIAILHPDEFFVNDFHRSIHQACDEGADHIICNVLEVLPAKSEEKTLVSHRSASVHQVFQTCWKMSDLSSSNIHNHTEIRFFRDGDGVEYQRGTNRKAAPHGLHKACSYRPMYMHQKMFDVGMKYTEYKGNKRADHFNGNLVGLKFPPRNLFTDRYGPFRKVGSLKDLQVPGVRAKIPLFTPDRRLHRHAPINFYFDQLDERDYDNKREDAAFVLVSSFKWHEYYALREQVRSQHRRKVFMVVMHGDTNKDAILKSAEYFVKGLDKVGKQQEVIPYSWFTLISL
jgi:hypothetical protein